MKTLKVIISILFVMFMTSCSYRGYKAHLFKPDKSINLVRSCGEVNIISVSKSNLFKPDRSTNLMKYCVQSDKPVSHDVSKTMKYYYKQKR